MCEDLLNQPVLIEPEDSDENPRDRYIASLDGFFAVQYEKCGFVRWSFDIYVHLSSEFYGEDSLDLDGITLREYLTKIADWQLKEICFETRDGDSLFLKMEDILNIINMDDIILSERMNKENQVDRAVINFLEEESQRYKGGREEFLELIMGHAANLLNYKVEA